MISGPGTSVGVRSEAFPATKRAAVRCPPSLRARFFVAELPERTLASTRNKTNGSVTAVRIILAMILVLQVWVGSKRPQLNRNICHEQIGKVKKISRRLGNKCFGIRLLTG